MITEQEIVNIVLLVLFYVVFPLLVLVAWLVFLRAPAVCSSCSRKGKKVKQEEKDNFRAARELGCRRCVEIETTYRCNDCDRTWTYLSPVIIVRG